MGYQDLRKMALYGTIGTIVGLSLLGGGLTTKANAQEVPALERKIEDKVNQAVTRNPWIIPTMVHNIGDEKYGGNNPFYITDEGLGIKPDAPKEARYITEGILNALKHNNAEGHSGKEIELFNIIPLIKGGDFHIFYSPVNGYQNIVEGEGISYERAFLTFYKLHPEKKDEMVFVRHSGENGYEEVGKIAEDYKKKKFAPYTPEELQGIVKARLEKLFPKEIERLDEILLTPNAQSKGLKDALN